MGRVCGVEVVSVGVGYLRRCIVYGGHNIHRAVVLFGIVQQHVSRPCVQLDDPKLHFLEIIKQPPT